MNEKIYEKIKSHLEDAEIFLTDDEIDTVLRVSNRYKTDEEHIGIRPERCKDNIREKAFQEHWLKENKMEPGLNCGHGILQGLFVNYENPLRPHSGVTVIEQINKRDRMIAATVIQWLGSNIGFCFLQETLKSCGYTILTIKKEE